MILPGTTLDLSIAGESDTNPVDGTEQTTGLYLRIRNGTHDGRLIRLGQRKCTIGASSSCTLRLVSPACQPVHCVIIRGRRGTAIRRWSHDTRLNGEEFLDSWLQPGDLLEVGDVTLEIVADRLSPDQHRGSLLQATDSERRRQVTHERLASSRQTNRRRVQRLVRLVRRVSQQLGLVHVELAGERDRVEQLSSQADLLHRQLDEVTAREQRSLEDNELHRQRIESLETELGELESQLATQRHDIEHYQQAWLKHCRQVMEMLQLTQGEFGMNLDQADSLPDLLPLAGELTERIAARHEAASQQNASLEAELETRRERLDDQFQQLLANQQHLLRREEELEELRRQLEERLSSEKAIVDRTQALTAELTAEQARRAEVETRFAAQHTELQAAWDELAQERAKLAEAVGAQIDVGEWEARVDRLQDELTQAKSECSQATAQIQILESERLELLQEVEKLQTKVLEASENAAAVAKDRARLADAQVELRSLNAKCQELQADLLDYQQLEVELQNYKQLETELMARREGEATTSAELETLKTALAEAEAKVSDLEFERQQLAAADSDRDGDDGDELLRLNAKCVLLENELATLNETRQRLESELAEFRNSQKSDAADIEQLKVTLAAAARERQELTLECQRLSDADRSEGVDTDSDLQALNAKCMTLEEELQALSAQRQLLEGELAEFRNTQESDAADIEQLKVTLASAARERESLDLERQRLVQELEEARNESNSTDVYEVLKERDSLLEKLAESERRLREAQVALEYERSDADPPMSMFTPPGFYSEDTRATTPESQATLGLDDDLDNRTIALTELRDAWQASNANPTLYEQSETGGDQTQTVPLDTYDEPPITDTLVNPQLAELVAQRDDTLTAATTGETDDEDAVDQADWSPEATPQPDFSQNSLYAEEHDDESEAVQPTIEPSAEQSDVQPPSSFSPTDTASILAKFGASLRFEEDEEDEMHETFSSPADAATSMPAPTSFGNSPASAQIERHDEDDESSIQSYMADLMRRNGVASGSPVPPAVPKPMPEPPKKSAPKPTPQYTEEDVAPTSLTPRAKLPNINLSAMRDVANSTARRDITRHTVRREREHAMFSWALSAAMLAVGAGLGMLTQQPFSLANWAAAACFVAAVFWASLGLNRWKQVRAAQTVPIDPRQHRDAMTVDDDVMSADDAAELPLDEE